MNRNDLIVSAKIWEKRTEEKEEETEEEEENRRCKIKRIRGEENLGSIRVASKQFNSLSEKGFNT